MSGSKPGFFSSTIGQKQMVGIFGLGLCGFVLTHVIGNFLMFKSAEAYNMYSYTLTSNPLIYVAELGLLGMFLGHLFLTIRLTIRNKKARPQGYAVSSNGAKGTSLIQKTMAHQGVVLLGFLVWHLLTFKFGTEYYVTYGDLEVRDIFKLLVEKFKDPLYAVSYVACMVIIALHLSHGFQSAFKSLGFNHPKYEPKIKCAGILFALFIGIGFIIQPIYIYFFL